MNLSAGVKNFFDTEWLSLQADLAYDLEQLKVLRYKKGEKINLPEKQVAARDWLQNYQVFRGPTAQHRERIAQNLVTFFDDQKKSRLRKDEIEQKFKDLETSLRSNANILTRTGKEQHIDSLTSKALWLCYPQDVPIMDTFAENSLRVLARILNLRISVGESRYANYMKLWFAAYKLVSPEIDKLALGDYPYKGRVFDKYLWWLGQENYKGIAASNE